MPCDLTHLLLWQHSELLHKRCARSRRVTAFAAFPADTVHQSYISDAHVRGELPISVASVHRIWTQRSGFD
jgi:hypothetical protein